MELIKIRKNFQVTIPLSLRRLIRLAEGDMVEAEVKDGALVIRPVKVVPTSQEYFYTKEWQAKEAETDAGIANGKLVGPVKQYHCRRGIIQSCQRSKTMKKMVFTAAPGPGRA